MSRKVTLTVSDEVYARMQRYRRRLNFSSLFSRTVIKAMDRLSEEDQQVLSSVTRDASTGSIV
jgi:hypothetical protein